MPNWRLGPFRIQYFCLSADYLIPHGDAFLWRMKRMHPKIADFCCGPRPLKQNCKKVVDANRWWS